MSEVSKEDIQHLIRDKYNGDQNADIKADEARLAAGEPLAYVIGWIPFLGLKSTLIFIPIRARSFPRPETEWWTEKLITHMREKFGEKPFVFLDLCAGSGAIGLAVLKALPNTIVWFGEIDPKHCEQIRENARANNLPEDRIGIRESNLFSAFQKRRFHIIASNPPYIPAGRTLDKSVSEFEPYNALYAGKDGLDYIDQILREAENRLLPGGELWMECDTSNIQQAQKIARSYEIPETTIHQDLYGRERLLVSHFE